MARQAHDLGLQKATRNHKATMRARMQRKFANRYTVNVGGDAILEQQLEQQRRDRAEANAASRPAPTTFPGYELNYREVLLKRMRTHGYQ